MRSFIFLALILAFTQCKNPSSSPQNEAETTTPTIPPSSEGKAIVQRDILYNEYKTIRGIVSMNFDTIVMQECINNVVYKIVDTLGRIEPTYKSIKSQYPGSKVYGEMEIVKSKEDNAPKYYYISKIMVLNQLTERSHCGPVESNTITGSGNEPGWKMEIVYADAKVMPYNLIMDYGQSKMAGTLKKVSGSIQSLPLVFETKDGNGKILKVTVTKTPCTDDAGNSHSASMSVAYLDKKFNGCASLPNASH